MAKIAPSILSADFANLERDIHDLEKNGADFVHVDIMDGIFVPNISIGIPVVQALRPVTKMPLDVHLMIDRPIRYVEEFVKAGADFVKLFPCVGDAPAYVKALCAPFNHIPFLAVGGVNADNVAEFIKAGAKGVGVGSCLANKKWADEGRYDLITEEAKRFMKNLGK